MQVLLENPKYIFAIVLIFVAFIVLVYFLLKSGNKYDLEGEYFLHPMKFISCKIKKTDKKDEFEVDFKKNDDLVPYSSMNTVNKKHPDIDNKIGKFKMTGETNELGNELIYSENGNTFDGVQLIQDYNIYAKNGDILVLLNKSTRESMVFKRMIN